MGSKRTLELGVSATRRFHEMGREALLNFIYLMSSWGKWDADVVEAVLAG
jgi:hypothetical protein